MYNNKTKSKALLSDADVSAHLEALVELLEEKKAIDLASLDLRQRSTVADYFVVGGANSRPHGQALWERYTNMPKRKIYRFTAWKAKVTAPGS